MKWHQTFRKVVQTVHWCLDKYTSSPQIVTFYHLFYCVFVFLNIYLFWLPWVLVVARDLCRGVRGSFSWGMRAFSCSMWDLVPWPGIEPRPPALGAQSLNRWTTRKSLVLLFEHLLYSFSICVVVWYICLHNLYIVIVKYVF